MKPAISIILATGLLATASPLHQNLARSACPSSLDTGRSDYQVIFYHDDNCNQPTIPTIAAVGNNVGRNVNTLDSSVKCYNDWDNNSGHYRSFKMVSADPSLVNNGKAFKLGYTERKCSHHDPCDWDDTHYKKWDISSDLLNTCQETSIHHKDGSGNIYKIVDS